MPKAKKLASGSYRCLAYSHTDCVFENGVEKKVNRYKSFTAPTKKEAEFLAAQFMMSRKKLSSASNKCFCDALEDYLSTKSNILSPSTMRGYRIMQRNAFSLLLNRPLQALTDTDLVQRQINNNAASYSVKSLKNQFGLISAVLRANKLIIDKPTFPVSKKNEIPVPDMQEIEKILKVIQQNPKIECQVLLALTCSLRQSEIAALTPSRISGDIVTVRGARVPDENNKLVYKDTNKTKSSARSIKMPEYLAKRLNALCENKKPDEWLFNMTPSNLLRSFKALLEANNIYPYTIHSMRHAFAALCASSGIPDLYIMEMGGWSSDHVMKKVYQYTFSEKASAAKSSLNNFFDASIATNKSRS